MSNLGALTTTFTPPGTACLSPHVGIVTGETILQIGTTSDCFPSSFTFDPKFYYSPGVCQAGYTDACSGAVGLPGVTGATCCPPMAIYVPQSVNPPRQRSKEYTSSGLSGCRYLLTKTEMFDRGFTCIPNLPESDTNPCGSTFASEGMLTIQAFSTITWGSLSTIGVTIVSYNPGDQIYAKGIIVRRAASDPEWGPASSTAGTTSPNPGSTMSTTRATPGSLVNSTAPSELNGDSSSLSYVAKVVIFTITGIVALLLLSGLMIAVYRCGVRKGVSSSKQVLVDNQMIETLRSGGTGGVKIIAEILFVNWGRLATQQNTSTGSG
ncbi:hypothetical protein EKO27_g9116 [Xylaria grammica]|uniref:Uncharacterized protein n=1 Tax=Xylaria grammica TaxID=363999 RepID=A0A439CV01_9PEZI|nr:hypothetical protein EKO27_g9116 [Xylaria grammica]